MVLRIGRLWILSLIILLSVGLAGCAGSPARALADASNRPGGLWAVVPCRHEPDIGDAVRSAVLVRTPKTCQAKWTHPTATQEQLVEDMTACSKAAFWVSSPSAAQDQRLACMESKGYRRETHHARHSAHLPTKELTHIRDIAGTWIGTAGPPGSPAVSVTVVLRDDGSYETITPSSRLVGNYWITRGEARYWSTTSGRTGTFELREHDGERRLIIIIDGGGGGELRPASK